MQQASRYVEVRTGEQRLILAAIDIDAFVGALVFADEVGRNGISSGGIHLRFAGRPKSHAVSIADDVSVAVGGECLQTMDIERAADETERGNQTEKRDGHEEEQRRSHE